MAWTDSLAQQRFFRAEVVGDRPEVGVGGGGDRPGGRTGHPRGPNAVPGRLDQARSRVQTARLEPTRLAVHTYV